MIDASDQQVRQNPPLVQALFSGTATADDRQLVRRVAAPVYDDLLARSEEEARAGAKIIVWPECGGGVNILQEDEASLLARASALARTTGTYVDVGLCQFLQQPVQSSFSTDEGILLDPTGSVIWRYEKTHPVIGDSEFVGDGQPPTVQTPYGRLSNVVCNDALFLDTLRRAGLAGADIMLVPSSDPHAINPYETQSMALRAIENGYSQVRQTARGLAMTVDYEGKRSGRLGLLYDRSPGNGGVCAYARRTHDLRDDRRRVCVAQYPGARRTRGTPGISYGISRPATRHVGSREAGDGFSRLKES